MNSPPWLPETASLVRVYFVPTRKLRPEDLSHLSVDERARAARFRVEDDRCRFVLARHVLRTVLGEALDLAPDSVPLRFGAQGKPELQMSVAGIGFNLSHSGDWILVAWARHRRIGVDIEFHREGIDMDAIAQRFFTPREIAVVRAGTASAQRYFFRYWTLKEAYQKATGGGLGEGLSNIDVAANELDSLDRLSLPEPDSPHSIGVQPLRAPDGYSAALAADGLDWSFETANWRWE